MLQLQTFMPKFKSSVEMYEHDKYLGQNSKYIVRATL